MLLGCGAPGVAGSPPGAASPPTRIVHLVVDAGSSGTRFCLWNVTPAPGACTAPERIGECLRPSEGKGLHSMTPAEIRALLDTSLQTLQSRAPIARAVLLATGGFRDEQGRIDASRPGFDAQWSAVREAFVRARIPAVARPIGGEEEGRLGWLGVAQHLRPAGAFTTIETGGATCQLATAADPAAAFADVRAVSDVIGQNHTWKRFAGQPAFRVCAAGSADPAGQDADACAALIEREVFAPSRLRAAIPPERRPLYALGTPWNYIFTRFTPHAPGHPTATSVTLAQLRAIARKYCALSPAQISAEADTYGPERVCYMLSYHVAFLRSMGGADEGAVRITNGEESWERGAAITGRTGYSGRVGRPDGGSPGLIETLFPDCE